MIQLHKGFFISCLLTFAAVSLDIIVLDRVISKLIILFREIADYMDSIGKKTGYARVSLYKKDNNPLQR